MPPEGPPTYLLNSLSPLSSWGQGSPAAAEKPLVQSEATEAQGCY